jgi:hypothetical protein
MPVLFDVVQTRSALGFAANHPPAGWNIGEDWLRCSSSLTKTKILPLLSSNGLMLISSPDRQVETSKPWSKG